MNNSRRQGAAHENDDWPEGGIADPDPLPDDDRNFNDCSIVQDNILNQTETDWIKDENDRFKLDIILPAGAILKYAYWKVRSIKEAQYGEVFYGKLLRNRCQELPTPTPEWVDTGKEVAIKRIDNAQMLRDRNCPERPLEEIKAMWHLQRVIAEINGEPEQEMNVEESRSAAERCLNNHVATCADVLTDKDYLYIIMPFCDGGEFFDYVSDKELAEKEARYWFKQLLDAVELLQRARICHRDIGFENTMIHRKKLAILIDFGVSLKIPYTDSGQRCLLRRQSAVGKSTYISPEILYDSESFDGHAVDLWALGVMLFVMLTQERPPWSPSNLQETMEDNEEIQEMFRLEFAEYVRTRQPWCLGLLSADLIELLQGMFRLDPRDRLSLTQIRAHKWTRGPVSIP